MFIPCRLLTALLLLLILPPAAADIVKPALIEISVFAKGHYRVEVRASIEALLTGINAQYTNTTEAPTSDEYDRLRELEAADLAAEFMPFHARMLETVALRFDDRQVTPRIGTIDIPVPGYTKVPRISLIVLEGEVPGDASTLTFYYPAAFGDSAVRVRQVDEAAEKWHWSAWQWIRDDRPSEPFSLTEVFRPPTVGDIVVEYTTAGFDHIIPRGLDHILFVFGLFLLSTHLRPLLWQVTMFTLAHTLTLAAATTGVVDVPPRIVEPLIALSIAYVGIENIWHRGLHNSRLVLVFAFGLLHGLGFASMLADFGMPDDAFVTALIAFNVGVELGQLAVILAAYLAVGWWFGDKPYYRHVVVIPASLVISAVGLYWAFERVSLFS
ncbi:MAG: HupE/UreJ family protein [Gammaproteobacteria bacterium]|nr:HupE/UreJ family protein [Gammaproteobacteria bacterium]